MSSDCIQYQRTTTSWCPSTPQSIGHAGTSAVSLQGVPWVTGVGHCWPKGCTRDTSMTIFRCIGGRATTDSCREDTVTTFFVTICNVSTCNSKQNAGKCTHAQSGKHIHTKTKPHTDAGILMHHTHKYRHDACEYMYDCGCTYHLKMC